MDEIYKTVAEAALFLIASYFIFYRKMLEELGKQVVKKDFDESLENFKKEIQLQLAKDIEPFKASLNRKNIEFQIYSSEFIKLRFLRLDELYSKLYELQKWIKANLFFYADDNDFQKKRNEFHIQYQIAEDSYYKASLYINDDIKAKVIDLLNRAFSSMQAFTRMYNSDPKKYEFMFNLKQDNLLQSMLQRNQKSLEHLYDSLDEFPALLRNIEKEFKNYLQMPNDSNSSST